MRAGFHRPFALIVSGPVLLCTVVFGAGPVESVDGDTTAAARALTYEQHVRPILKVACFHCHGEHGETPGGLDVRLVRLLVAGGDSGAAIVPGDVESSLLWQRIASDEMPKGEKKLTAPQKKTIRRWIEQGARTARPEPESIEDARFTLEELEHWAFQAVSDPAIPKPPGYDLRTPIDGFIARRLAAEGLPFSEPAERRTLIRRVTFDVIGLPPTPQDVEAFVEDSAPDAYARLVDRLLASPQFGVRWGRHWLDVAGYSESDPGLDSDPKRPHAWRYRDYVVDAFNDNKPVDVFFREQLAGDELLQGEVDIYDARHLELLTATGFLRMAPDSTQTTNTVTTRNTAAADAVQVISSSLLGVTVGCAQCHDHKYDPIGIDDYYRFRAVFDPVFPLANWQTPNGRYLDLTTADAQAAAALVETEARKLDAELNARRQMKGEELQVLRLAELPDDIREAARVAVRTESGKRTDEQKALLKLHPRVRTVGQILGQLVEYDRAASQKFEEERQKIAALRATKPPQRLVMATTEQAGVVPASAVFFRGNPDSPGEGVLPAELTVLRRLDRDVVVPVNDASLKTTGRRLAYARQLTDGKHPLTARVFVNRLWLHHMGRGLVATPSDFGLAGDAPSHPELLDWLAQDFMRHGWDQKRLHRMLLLSTTYRQRSRRSSEHDRSDPENTWYGRAHLRRLEAEAIRDAILLVTGRLSRDLGGPSIPVTRNGEGKAVLGVQIVRDGLPRGVDDQHADAFRRSAFIEVQRRLPLNMLATFDQPEMKPNCDLRRSTTVATQALWFLNDALIVERADDLAWLLFEISPRSDVQLRELFLRLFAEPPSVAEVDSCRSFLTAQSRRFREHSDPEWQKTIRESPDAPGVRAMASLCQVLLASNRFLYVD